MGGPAKGEARPLWVHLIRLVSQKCKASVSVITIKDLMRFELVPIGAKQDGVDQSRNLVIIIVHSTQTSLIIQISGKQMHLLWKPALPLTMIDMTDCD